MSKHSSSPHQGADSTVVSRPTAVELLLLIIVLWGASWRVMKIDLTYIPPLAFAATVVLGEPVTPTNILGFLLIGGGLIFVFVADVGD